MQVIYQYTKVYIDLKVSYISFIKFIIENRFVIYSNMEWFFYISFFFNISTCELFAIR